MRYSRQKNRLTHVIFPMQILYIQYTYDKSAACVCFLTQAALLLRDDRQLI